VWKPFLVIVVFGVAAAAFLGLYARTFVGYAYAADSIEHVLIAELATLRQDVEAYRVDHGVLPDEHVVEQLTQRTEADGRVAVQGRFGPYLRTGLPRNPVNQQDSVRCVPTLPLAPDGASGWYYVLPTGEIRANAAGQALGGAAWFAR